MTLFTSDIKKIYYKTIIIYLCASVLTIIFDRVYAIFAHGVSSYAMSLAFLYPLVLGVVFYAIMFFINWYNKVSYNLYNAAVATITIGSILLGVNEIAGADTPYYVLYYYIAFILFGMSVIFPVVTLIIRKVGKGR